MFLGSGSQAPDQKKRKAKSNQPAQKTFVFVVFFGYFSRIWELSSPLGGPVRGGGKFFALSLSKSRGHD
ncbi:hypothetical protein KSB_62950 [Ktedonobacter robiniae]|uniref:Uncharacterized protein n=1 Tax=Ktedonobacter robiniae TaxID=2778365 RepID=A0ABQ3UZV6_9CHLR|nr:hypothetical protein KSB_62950 [Ktedonobacter robiniae]